MLNFSCQIFLAFVFFSVNVDTLCVNFYLIKINIGWHLPAYKSSTRLFSKQSTSCLPVYQSILFLSVSLWWPNLLLWCYLSLSVFTCLLSVGPPAVFLSVCNSYLRISVWHPAPESIKWFTEDQAFSPSYDVAPRPPPSPSPVSNIDRRHTGRLRMRDKLLTGEGGRGWGEAYPDDGEKAWFSINHSILSALENE